jgi:SAM-dependent methyltransferase
MARVRLQGVDGRVHPLAETGFAAVADAYERGRPGYPDELVDLLRGRLGVGPGTRTLDVGAGTGKLTRTLLATGADVLAAEPLADMRRVLADVLPADQILDATAEDLPLPAGSLDVVAAGDAFHWFDGTRALDELARVLRPGGELVMVWHGPFPTEAATWRADLQTLLRSLRGEHPYYTKDHGRAAFSDHTAFGPLRNVNLSHHHEVDRGGLVDLLRSTSFIAALEPDAWQEAMAAARRIADSAPPRISMSYSIDVWITRRR